MADKKQDNPNFAREKRTAALQGLAKDFKSGIKVGAIGSTVVGFAALLPFSMELGFGSFSNGEDEVMQDYSLDQSFFNPQRNYTSITQDGSVDTILIRSGNGYELYKQQEDHRDRFTFVADSQNAINAIDDNISKLEAELARYESFDFHPHRTIDLITSNDDLEQDISLPYMFNGQAERFIEDRWLDRDELDGSEVIRHYEQALEFWKDAKATIETSPQLMRIPESSFVNLEDQTENKISMHNAVNNLDFVLLPSLIAGLLSGGIASTAHNIGRRKRQKNRTPA